jgi:hypothetical protein
MKRTPASKYMGWALVAKDITDMVNLFRMARVARPTKKKAALKGSGLNPFSTERKLSRGLKMKAKLPGVPDWIEIAQLTDQWFGVGISFGAIVGMFTDLHWAIKRGRTIVIPPGPSRHPIEIITDGFSSAANLQQWGP